MTTVSVLFDVIIVGCGPAGIAAAIDLARVSQLKFTLLEARDRVGGRVFTDTTTFGKNVPIDLGAQWLHHYRSENPLYKYHELSSDIHIDNHFILRSSDTPFYDVDGTRISPDTIERAESIFNRLSNLVKCSSLPVDKSIWDVIKEEYSNGTDDPQIKRIVDLFFGIYEQYEASNLDQLSAKYYLKSDCDIPECNLSLPNGLGVLMEKIVQQHQLPVELNCVVNRIDTSSSDSIVRVHTSDGRLFLCKHVLVTIPLGCLKDRSIEFVPSLPEWKQNAIDFMGVGLSNKIFLQFPYVFWEPAVASFFCTSSRIRFFLCRPSDCILQIKLAARTAIELEDKPDKEIIDEVMSLLRCIFSDRNIPEPTRSIITKWNQDRFARGAYSNFSVGTNEQTLIDLARECNGQIHWAGEYANPHGSIGCVDSAFESGQQAAKNIILKLK